MRIIKEDLDNLERVKDRKTTQGIMMKDAEQQSNKSEDNFKKVAGAPEELKEKKPFLGAEKQETPKEAEIPKPELEESLFEEAEKHTYYAKFKQNGKPYTVEFDAYNIEGAEQAFLRSFPDIKSRNEYEILSNDGGSLTHDYDENINEDVDEDKFMYQLLSRMKSDCDYVINVGNKGAFKYLYSGSVDEQISDMMDLYNYLVNKNGPIEWINEDDITRYKRELHNIEMGESLLSEAGGMKNGVLISTDGEPFTFWDKIYAELDGNLHPQENDYKKLSELPMKNRKDKYQEMSVDNEGNIKVFAPTRDKLKHAVNVAEYYDLDYKAGTSLGYNDPEKAFYCTIYIPEYIQDKYVTYDARKQKYHDDDEKEQTEK